MICGRLFSSIRLLVNKKVAFIQKIFELCGELQKKN